MKKKSLLLIVLGLIIASFLIWESYKKDKDSVLNGKKDVNVQLQWFDGAQFAGLYVALEKGYFSDENLNVTLTPIAGYTSDPIALLTDNEADIAIATADQVLINKDKGKEIRAFGTVFNRSLACFTFKSDLLKGNSNDSIPLDILKNKKIAVYKKFDTESILLALDYKFNLNLNKQNIIQAPQLALEAFINDDIDILGSYMINEPIKFKLNGLNVKYLDPAKYGVKFYSDTYIAKTEVWNNTGKNQITKETLVHFLRAANKGWSYCKLHPKEAIDIMFSHIKNKTKSQDYKMELLSLTKAIQYIGDGPNNIPSYMLKEKWVGMEKDLYNIRRISQKGYIDELCDFDLINKVNE